MRASLKKLVEAYQISDNEEEQYIAKGCALILANFHIDPTGLDDEEWAMMFQQACWIERTRLVNLAKILAKLFAPQGD